MSFHPQLAEAIMVLFPNAVPRVDFTVKNDGTGPVIAMWNLPSNPPTEAEIAAAVAQIPAAQLAAKRADAKSLLDTDTKTGRQQRALIALLVSELNLLRAWIESFKAATALATSLANLQTRVAALNATPARTGPQVTTAIKDAIDLES